jgi:outer membrane autotransporter protein
VQATDRNGDFGTRSYTLVIEHRADPTEDAEMVALLDRQMQSGVGFARTQINNVMLHLLSTRAGAGCGLRQGVSVNVGTESVTAPGVGGDCDEPRASVWTAGSLDYGRQRRDKLTSTGLSLGVDVPLSAALTVGAAIGTGFDTSRLGSNGTTSDARSFDLMAYGSARAAQSIFVDAMVGYGSLHNDSRRAIGAGARLESERSGHMLFASISVGAQLRANRLVVSPYLRNDLMSISLDGSRESGPALLALGVGETRQTVDVFVAGTRVAYDWKTSWGRLSPVARAEYHHRFASDYTESVFYADRPETTYGLARRGEARDDLSIAAGLEAAMGRFTLGLEYGSSADDVNGFGGHSLRSTLSVAF